MILFSSETVYNGQMKNFLLALALSCSLAHAGAKGGFTDEPATGIVTPDIAVGMRDFEHFWHDVNGNMVVCRKSNWSIRTDECSLWEPVVRYVPKGRVYVGFRVVSGGYGYRRLEIYWK